MHLHRRAGEITRRALRPGGRISSVSRSLATVLPRARMRYGCSWGHLVQRTTRVLRRRFVPDEAYQLGLFDPALQDERVSTFLSKSALKQIQRRLNPAPWDRLVEDKGLFYRVCGQEGLPVPELYAIVYPDRPGWTALGAAPQSCRDWEEYLGHALPREFIIKPCGGVYGRGVTAYVRRGTKLRDSNGREVSLASILHTVVEDPSGAGYVVQQRLRSHPAIARLTGTDALQTLRVDVVATTDGPRILSAGLKIIRNGNIIDNVVGGTTGNFIMRVSIDEGILGEGRILDPRSPGFQSVLNHPGTGTPLTGFTVPLWGDVRRTVMRAMDVFRPLKAIGWDVAVTGDGVFLIEGNTWFDPAIMLQGDFTPVARVGDPAGRLTRLYVHAAKGRKLQDAGTGHERPWE